jgi:hypothetical protein
MSKVLKTIILMVTTLALVLPAYAQEAAKEQQPASMEEPQASTEQLAAFKEEQGASKDEPLAFEEEQGESKEAPLAAKQVPAAARKQQLQQEASKEQIKGLDEQVQEIKTDVLSIATELNRLEEKLLYPSDTQVALFVSLADGEKFRLDGVDIELDGKSVAHHLYSYKELEALQKGGVQRIHVGNLRAGEHAVQVTVTGKSVGGSDFHKSESFKITKGIGPKLVGLVLADTGFGSKTVTLKDW